MLKTMECDVNGGNDALIGFSIQSAERRIGLRVLMEWERPARGMLPPGRTCRMGKKSTSGVRAGRGSNGRVR
jgi:hypothetical protein